MTSIAESLARTFGEPRDARRVSDAALAKFQGVLPDALLDAWRTAGWCGFGEGLVWLTNPEEFRGPLGEWTPLLEEWGVGPDAHVILRGAFGHLYLWLDGHVWSFDPLGHPGGGGVSKVTAELPFFVEELLAMPKLQEKILLSHLLPDAIVRNGPIGYGEAYTFAPVPALGGKIAVESIGKGALREYLVLLAQCAG